jgi:hypothetical protein
MRIIKGFIKTPDNETDSTGNSIQFTTFPTVKSFNKTNKLLSSAPPLFSLKKESMAIMPMLP